MTTATRSPTPVRLDLDLDGEGDPCDRDDDGDGCIAQATLRRGKRALGSGSAVIRDAGRTCVFVRCAKGAKAALRRAACVSSSGCAW